MARDKVSDGKSENSENTAPSKMGQEWLEGELQPLPKRARCPYCDRLFPIDRLDQHVIKCRSKGHQVARQRPTRRKVIVDGNNVAYYLSYDSQPHLDNIILAIKSLRAVGLQPIVVISAALKHRIDRPMTLSELIEAKSVIEAKRGMDDDLLIIQLAQKLNADIVSNDRFLNWQSRFPWIANRLRRYRMTTSGLILL